MLQILPALYPERTFILENIRYLFFSFFLFNLFIFLSLFCFFLFYWRGIILLSGTEPNYIRNIDHAYINPTAEFFPVLLSRHND
jgi:hypothetical protein